MLLSPEFRGISSLNAAENGGENGSTVLHKRKFRIPMEMALRNGSFLSLVVVKLVLSWVCVLFLP